MAGAITLDKLENILQQAGFTEIDIERQVVSDQYANKWGIDDVDLKHYLRSSTITAYKPK
ncbi:hypothetical protein [Facklamia sp. 7083-14-GEN3]|uniref:hypothetical protein n=1 Tax=Facklamia sp. 7083-14-GEN3 TaxID=2973478 RepID=UPI00215BC976|nr:hypothetical protein [Facklamia sp. 7083-14-GEN3]MCR8968589.1 hypothetical protein [Facklamia sp. 7083-14-GEN3]